jgi:hypothetical protein
VGKACALLGIVLSLLLGACTFPLETPTPRPSPSPSPTPSPTPVPTPSPSPTPSPTPEPIAPDFDAGEIVATSIDGLRVRSLPGSDRPIVTGLLPLAFELEVVMGPIPVDGLAWYLVADADAREPNFDEGWVAAGYEPDPLLAATGRVAADSTAVTSMAQTGDAEQGPIEIGEGDHAIRWVGVDPERRRCAFAVSMTPVGGGAPVPAIRATIGTGIDRGTLQPQSFGALGVRGPAFVSVVSDCAWALTIVRVPPTPTPTPDPSVAP